MTKQKIYLKAGLWAVLAAGVVAFSLPASVQAAYPDRPVTIMVGYGAGGGADMLARLYAEKLSARLNQTFIVENKPGAGATLAASSVAHSKPDGYTLMVAPTAVFTITPNVRRTNYAPLTDFTPIATLATGLDIITSSQAIPAKNLSEFIVLAKENPGKYSFASSGLATSTHFMGEIFKEAAGIDILHVPYKSSNDYLPDLIQGRVSIAFDPVLLNQVNAGKLNLLGVAQDTPLDSHPQAQTSKAAGIDMTAAYERIWYGIVGPSGMPEETVAMLSAAIKEASKDPSIAERLAATGIRPDVITGDDFAKKMRDDSAYYQELIKRLNIQLEN